MLRISQTTSDGSRTTFLRLDGQVSGPWVAELRRVCDEALGRNGHGKRELVLDLAGVSFLDPDAVALFRDLVAKRAVFKNGSAFVAEQLKGVADVGA
jgi:hypothetical protein